MSWLGITHTDILQKLRGVVLEDCSRTGTEAAGQTALETHIKTAYAKVKSRLPSRYRRMLYKCPGELFANCAAGTTQFTLSLSNATDGTVLVYQNFSRAWNTRTRADALTSDEVSLSGQVVTLSSSVADGDRIVIEYDYDGTCLSPSAAEDDWALWLCVANLAAFYAGREAFQWLADGEIPEYIDDYKTDAMEWLEAIQSQDAGIPILDDVVLYEDWDVPARGARSIHLRRG